jgi:hypothetical protein
VTAPPVRPSPVERPADLAAVLDWQRRAGNAAVQRRLADAAPVVARQVPPVYTAPTPGSAPAPAPTGPAPVTLAGATPLEQAADGFTRGTPDAVDAAWGVLFSRAMYDLLPLLEGLRAKGFWSVITVDAGPRGGSRLENAVHAVNLKTKLSPITPDELRALIDRLADMFPDQRADILRYLGKYVVIPVDGIDLDISYVAGATSASCAKEVQDTIDEANFFIKEYAAAGADKRNKTGAQIEAAVKASLARQGFGVTTAGTTSSTGVITITATTMSKAQPILTRNTEIHESVHAHHVADLQKTYGKGTPAFTAAFGEAQDWVRDEINARRAEIAFLTKVLAALKKLEKLV